MVQVHKDPEECRVKMVETVVDLQDPKVPREILVFLVTLVYRVRKALREPKDIRDAMGTKVEGETRVDRENQAGTETRDIQDT